QPLLMQVPAAQREPLLAVLHELSALQLDDLATLAQRTPPQERDALRRELLSTAATSRTAWLRQRLRRCVLPRACGNRRARPSSRHAAAAMIGAATGVATHEADGGWRRRARAGIRAGAVAARGGARSSRDRVPARAQRADGCRRACHRRRRATLRPGR